MQLVSPCIKSSELMWILSQKKKKIIWMNKLDIAFQMDK